jgi:hypothetical protein
MSYENNQWPPEKLETKDAEMLICLVLFQSVDKPGGV